MSSFNKLATQSLDMELYTTDMRRIAWRDLQDSQARASAGSVDAGVVSL
jgi:hypothetical protein